MKVFSEAKYQEIIKRELISRCNLKDENIDLDKDFFGHEFIITDRLLNITVRIDRTNFYDNTINMITNEITEELVDQLKILSHFINNKELLENIKVRVEFERPSRISLLLGE